MKLWQQCKTCFILSPLSGENEAVKALFFPFSYKNIFGWYKVWMNNLPVSSLFLFHYYFCNGNDKIKAQNSCEDRYQTFIIYYLINIYNQHIIMSNITAIIYMFIYGCKFEQCQSSKHQSSAEIWNNMHKQYAQFTLFASPSTCVWGLCCPKDNVRIDEN